MRDMSETLSPPRSPAARSLPVRELLRGLSSVLMVTGVLVLADAGLTLLWQEPVSALYATLRQHQLGGALAKLDRAAPSVVDRAALVALRAEPRRIAFLARELERREPDGAAVGRIRIPHIGASFVLIKGTDEADLKAGPGVYPQTRFPGVPGTTAIAGHRTTYLAPFRHIDALRMGDRITIEMPYGRFTYSVIGHRIVAPTDVAVIDPVGYSRLVLSACNPLYSAAQRIIVFARLIATQPRGAASSS